MRRLNLTMYILLAGLIAIPMLLVPLFGIEIIDRVPVLSEQASPSISGEPVRLVSQLVSQPSISRTGGGSVVAVIDLPYRDAADLLCKQGPQFQNAVKLFLDEHPDRLTAPPRTPPTDSVLERSLAVAFPNIPMDAARFIRPDRAELMRPLHDLYECQGTSFRRIAPRQRL